MGIRNKCQLITYPDSLGGDLRTLRRFLDGELRGALGGVHILPFYPSSGDRGFAPLAYQEVDASFGTWEDVDAIGSEYDVMVDFMVNHISRQSRYFKDYIEKGRDSPYADLFIQVDRLFNGEPCHADLSRIFRRKPDLPFLEVEHPDGSREKVWCTFSDEQIDIDVRSKTGQEMIAKWLAGLAGHGVKIIRLDAFAYAVKKPGTSCFFVEPETTNLLRWLKDLLEPRGIEILPEIHAPSAMQLELAREDFLTYDFNLPLLVLQAIYDANNRNLLEWLRVRPQKMVTTLDTHDGLPVLDVSDRLSAEEIERTKKNLFARGAEERFSVALEYMNRNVYQLNSTYYSAVGEDDDVYIASRAIQMFTPGVPQVYYVGLLAGRNDIEFAERTKHGRNVNRHNYTRQEVIDELKRPVVQRLLNLMRFRNECPAFNGAFQPCESREDEISLLWKEGNYEALLRVDLRSKHSFITHGSGRSQTFEI